MDGDILIIHDHHRKAAKACVALLKDTIKEAPKPYTITVAGESGAGKSETAASIAEELEKLGYNCYVFQQDDYFVFPPKTNAREREKDINWVGTQEVKLGLLDEQLAAVKDGLIEFEKPLVIFKDDSITSEVVNLADKQILIAEGTYTTALENADCKIFIDRNKFDTKEARLERNREKQDEFLEQILSIEHEIISGHKKLADVIISKDYDAFLKDNYEQ